VTGTVKRRWSFRTRLTALIAAVFVAGGTALLVVQYFLVQGLFNTAIDGLIRCVDDDGVTVMAGGNPPADAECTEITGSAESDGISQVTVGNDGEQLLVEQTTVVSQEVLSGLLLWSVVILLVFTAVAVVAASWLSRRSFVRIGQITDTTKRITHHDLHQRLDLPGPADEIKELGDTIDGMLNGLEASFTRQARFITNASHELRTPLTTTRTALEIPLVQGHVPPDLEPAVQRALEANQRSEQLIAALLKLAQATTAARGEIQESVDLAAIIDQCITEHQGAIANANLSVTTHLPSVTIGAADPTLLGLAIDNLIDNAIRHNQYGGTIQITTGTADDGGWVQVTNSGARFSADEAARLIEPFNRGHTTRTYSHTTRTTGGGASLGLGLTLVQNIADWMGATLQLTPNEDGGVVARLEF